VADDNSGLRARERERDGVIDRGGYVACGFESGSDVIIARSVIDALGPIPAGRAIAATQGHNDDESAVQKPSHCLGFAPPDLGVMIVGECVVRNDDNTRRRVAGGSADACL
jgi:hypothetical protein